VTRGVWEKEKLAKMKNETPKLQKTNFRKLEMNLEM